jgi:hypothetical protein
VVAIAGVVGPRPALAQEHGPGLLPPGDWTEDQQHYLLDLIARTEGALPAFADPSQLEALGFIDFGVTAPGGYDHFINWEWVDDEHILDPEHPESLVFQRTWNDATQQTEYRLVSAMFLLPSQYDMSNIPEDLAWLPGWHNHADVCVNDGGTFAGFSGLGGQCAVGRPFDKPPMMHVWIVDNPCGHRFGGIDVSGLHCDVHGGTATVRWRRRTPTPPPRTGR